VRLVSFWFPLVCIGAMVGAAVVCGLLGQPKKCVFWILDAAITGWSAFMLN